MILVLESSGSYPSVGIVDTLGRECFFKQHTEVQSHAEQLGVMVQEAMGFLADKKYSLQAVAINDGPGSYTGLRIGSSLAKGLCFSMNIPMIAVSGMLGMGGWMLHENDNFAGVWVMLDARRDEVYGLHVVRDSASNELPRAMILPQDLTITIDKSTGFVCDCADKVGRLLNLHADSWPLQVHISVRHLYSLIIRNFNEKKFCNLAYYEPFYLKEFQAGISKKFSLI